MSPSSARTQTGVTRFLGLATRGVYTMEGLLRHGRTFVLGRPPPQGEPPNAIYRELNNPSGPNVSPMSAERKSNPGPLPAFGRHTRDDVDPAILAPGPVARALDDLEAGGFDLAFERPRREE